MTIREYIQAAACARSNLNNYYAIIALCESGLFSGAKERAIQKIVDICKAQSEIELRRYDSATAAILKATQ